MTVSEDTTAYIGSCNPPRRAKRARTTADAAANSKPAVPNGTQRRPHLLPRTPPSYREPIHPDSSDEDEDDYDPVVSAPAPKRRGRKPGPLSRSARESQRKLNHSRIEKARRTKINEALSTLSSLVNDAEAKKNPQHVVSTDTKGKDGGKKSEKEFKLDVLVKAVTYMQELISHVKELENRRCAQCAIPASTSSPTLSATGKRKRDVDDVEVVDDIESDAVDADDEKAADNDDEIEELLPPRPPSRRTSVQPTPSPRLPPIASWLPHPYVDPSCIAALTDANANNAQITSHLPSPPLSGSFRVAAPDSINSLPSLTLPGPARPVDTNKLRQSLTTSTRRLSTTTIGSSRSAITSPTVSPTWTPEDEKHAASMLLQMSTSPNSTGSSLAGSSAKAVKSSAHGKGTGPLTVQTPSSLLGM
ncbi:unnamed protein product [Somion occarium]|uniref:BHLH domain-containing protein n=1 Tax=Somion occarium TaxID=3059160 RepID=A0ABP1DR47_9APHY